MNESMNGRTQNKGAGTATDTTSTTIPSFTTFFAHSPAWNICTIIAHDNGSNAQMVAVFLWPDSASLVDGLENAILIRDLVCKMGRQM